MPKPLTKNAVLNNLVALEQFLSKLKEDFAAAKYRKNELIAACIDEAGQDLDTGFKALAEDQLKRANRFLSLSWIKSNYARQLFDSETVEFELGEGNYLELEDKVTDWRSQVMKDLAFLEETLLRLRAEISKSIPSR